MDTYIRDGRAPIPRKDSTSRVMRGNKAKDTKPELALRKALWRAEVRGYRLHVRELPGRPDIAFGRARLAVFINGCFWHRCPHCNLPPPKSNTDFWRKKFDANVARDLKKIAALELSGWRVMTIWECQIEVELLSCLQKIEAALKAREAVLDALISRER